MPVVVAEAEAATARLQDLAAEIAADQTINTVEQQLPALTREVDARLADSTKILAARPSLDTLRTLEAGWRSVLENLPAWRRELTARATKIEAELAELAPLSGTWEQTLALAQSSNAPPELAARAEAMLAAIKQTREQLENGRTRILTLQSRVSEEETRTNAALGTVKETREAMVGRLFVKDSPPIWSASVRTRTGIELWRETRQSIVTQFAAMREYAARQADKFWLHGLLLLVFAGMLYWARRKVRPWVEAEPTLKPAATIFELPVAAALLLSVFLSSWLYPQSPRLLTALMEAAALAPTIIILRRMVTRPLYPVLNALVVFYFADRLRDVAQALPLVSRLLFLAEMLGGLIFLGWFIKSSRLANVDEAERGSFWRSIRLGARIGLPVFVLAFSANAFGYISLARLIGNAALGSVYTAVIFYVALRILDGLVMFALRVRPFTLLGMVENHRHLLRRRVRAALRWLAEFAWAVITLELLSLREPVVTAIWNGLKAELAVGTLRISLGNVLAFLLTVWLAFLLSRFIRFMLEEDVYPRVEVARGVPYAISTMLHYALLLMGFLLALGAFGFDLNKFTILAGAFGVGIGFGLQTIVNNFVSGLILLFERPVNVGDMVQMGEQSGELKHIGLRASVLRTLDGSEVIMPNSKLISDEVINWTLSDQQRRLEIKVGVAYGTDPERVLGILAGVASAHPDILDDPGPTALFVDFGDNSLDFKLRVWTNRYDRWEPIRSELMVAVNQALDEARISIPFPQRDLHLVSLTPEVRKGLAEGN
ncbi:MAG: mechanosensitive ion channel domain-containing protein [Blastocatellia bacterium]